MLCEGCEEGKSAEIWWPRPSFLPFPVVFEKPSLSGPHPEGGKRVFILFPLVSFHVRSPTNWQVSFCYYFLPFLRLIEFNKGLGFYWTLISGKLFLLFSSTLSSADRLTWPSNGSLISKLPTRVSFFPSNTLVSTTSKHQISPIGEQNVFVCQQ